MSSLIVRASTEADVARCTEIYGHHVLHGTASFEVEPPDVAGMKRRRAEVLDLGLPYLVAERAGRVIGYTHARNWVPRPAYEFSVEDSIYVDKDAVRQGVGSSCRWVHGHPQLARRRASMSREWEYQLRIDLADELAEVARRDPGNPAIAPLVDILGRHHATMKCQFDAFADYVAEAERRGTGKYPLYAWTKATIENPEKRARYVKSFTLYVDGHEVYAKPLADALEADLQPLVGSGLITRLSRYDTNPANNPQPPTQHRK